jgi:hypothetical protein
MSLLLSPDPNASTGDYHKPTACGAKTRQGTPCERAPVAGRRAVGPTAVLVRDRKPKRVARRSPQPSAFDGNGRDCEPFASPRIVRSMMASVEFASRGLWQRCRLTLPGFPRS